MVRICLIVEGDNTPNNNNGDLGEGFGKLFKKLGCPVSIKMKGGKKPAIDTFKNIVNGKSPEKSCNEPYLLIDLDAHEKHRESDLRDNDLWNHKERVFYMIQEMESWFLSQPNIIRDFYGENVAKKIKTTPPKHRDNPFEELVKITRLSSSRSEYHKVRHGYQLLTMLNADKLKEDFPEIENLINKLKH